MKTINNFHFLSFLLIATIFVGCGKPHPTEQTDDQPQDVCGDGKVTGSETCDPQASGSDKCPVSCPSANSNACTTQVLVGENCHKKCESKTITTCINNDGCCPSSCTESNDNDCVVKIGEKCTKDDDCGSGETCKQEVNRGRFFEGYCTASCSGNHICPNNTECIELDDGERLCMKACAKAEDCRENYLCYKNTCIPNLSANILDSDVGKQCTKDEQCGKDGKCITQQKDNSFFMGYCTASCKDGLKCPQGSECIDDIGVDGFTGPHCIQNCNLSCRRGYTCNENNHCVSKTDTCTTTPKDSCTEPETCVDFDGDNHLECMNVKGLPGSACYFDRDCVNTKPGGFCVLARFAKYGHGYCQTDCSNDASVCGPGNKCHQYIGNHKKCLTFCDENQCPGSGVCRKDISKPFCDHLPDTIYNNHIGDACKEHYDCGNLGVCLKENVDEKPNGYCTTTCYYDSDCPTESQCVNKLCRKTCTNNQDCRPGYTCDPKTNVCLWRRKTCTSNKDCPDSDMSCIGIPSLNKKYCYRSNLKQGDKCIRDEQCPNDSKCFFYDRGKMCAKACPNGESDCPTGSTCFHFKPQSDGTPNNYCMTACSPLKPCSLPNTDCREVKDENQDTKSICWGAPEDDHIFIGALCYKGSDCGLGYCHKSEKTVIKDDTEAGICVSNCSIYDSQPCPYGSVCHRPNPSSEKGICVPQCQTNDDCMPHDQQVGFTCKKLRKNSDQKGCVSTK